MKIIIKQEGTPQTVIEYSDPLRSKIPPVDSNEPLSRRCIDIIIEARLIWGYNSIPSSENEIIDWKIVQKKRPVFLNSAVKVAINIDGWYRRKSLLFLRGGFQADNALLKTNIEDCRKDAKVGENISDQQFCAIFAICEAFDAIHSIQRGKPEEAIKEKVLSANTFLKLAKVGFEPEKLDVPRTKLDEPIANDMIFFDEENGCLWLGDGNKKPVEPEDAKILKAIKDILTSNKRSNCRIEEIILSAYGKEIPTRGKITQNPMYDKYRSAVGAINGKYRELLETQDKNCRLIQADGRRIVKLSRNVVFRNMLRKQP